MLPLVLAIPSKATTFLSPVASSDVGGGRGTVATHCLVSTACRCDCLLTCAFVFALVFTNACEACFADEEDVDELASLLLDFLGR